MKLTIKAKIISKTRDEVILAIDKEQLIMRINDHTLGVTFLDAFTGEHQVGEEMTITIEPTVKEEPAHA